MKNRIKNLTPSKIKKISSLASIIWYVFFTIQIIISPMELKDALLILLLLYSVGLIVYPACTHILNTISELKKDSIIFLSKEKFTEVLFTPSPTIPVNQMTLEIFEKNGCKFYAKLTKNNDVILVVKNNSNHEIYNSIISNYSYFTSYFKKKETK